MSKIQFFFVLVFLATGKIFAQPGDEFHVYTLRTFSQVQDSIVKYPKDPFYKWARIQILFNTSFNLFTKPTDKIEAYAIKYMDLYRQIDLDSVTVMKPQPCQMCPNTPVRILNPAKEMSSYLFNNQKELLNDLNTLIESGNEIKVPPLFGKHYSANKASFLYKRGQFYYLSGKSDKALKDYLEALEANPSATLKNEITISIAAYYYNTEQEIQGKEKLALEYLDKSGSALGLDEEYEKKRFELLKATNDSAFVINYLKEASARSLKIYLNAIINSYQSEKIKELYDYQKYQGLIFDYLKEIQPNITIEDLKKQMIDIIEKL